MIKNMENPELNDMETMLAEPVERTFVPVPHAKTMGNLDKIRYTHTDMIDHIIANPWVSQNDLAARYGYTPAWVSNIMASDAWQAAMATAPTDPSLARMFPCASTAIHCSVESNQTHTNSL